MWNIVTIWICLNQVQIIPPKPLPPEGGGAKSPLLASYKPVLWIEQNCEVSL